MAQGTTKAPDIGYAVLITYTDPEDNVSQKSIILDAVEDTTVNNSSTITEHPTIDGTPLADHMYRNPIVMSIRGAFSLNGKKAFVVNKTGVSLARVEELFEQIKNDGIICMVTKIKVVNEQQMPQFTVRQNMALQSITWTEGTNTLGFSFTFQEVLRADVQELVADPSDEFAPSIEFAETTNFFDTLVKWEDVDKEVLDTLYKEKLCPDDFLEGMIGLGTTILAIELAAGLSALVIAFASNPVGWVAGIVVAAAAVVWLGISAIFRAIKKRQYKIKAFKYYKNKTKMENETKRFCDFVQSVHDEIATLEQVVKVWAITTNGPQEAIINVDNSYYIIEFEKRNTDASGAFTIIASDINGTVLANTSSTCAKETYYDCNSSNYLFKTAQNTYVHLILLNKDAPEDTTSYMICASSIKPEDFSDMLTKIIMESIKY